ncbi:tetratricopeptide repeat protein [Tenacibaculum jejuense]|uniref:Tetratricopeptide repeat protein n=1 Tax=Tenacibaculum jejuense TaxID=584609 RepID=A0A238UDC9_9FLAO|nr:tetratricopeptide repeat protein [Tenacibaculum jejuense]SNR17203.1 conserved protein of unknown function [Tenacibaculum jejuense]
MVKENYIEILNQPEKIQDINSSELQSIVDKYPYFQSARVLHLKALKDQKSFRYNNELKLAAAHTLDRAILFNFITSTIFKQSEITSKSQEDKRKESNPKKDKKESIEEELEIGKPLTFTKNEAFSFNQWLQLSSDIPEIPEEKIEKKERNIQEDIIDRFINNNPKISRVNKNASVPSKQNVVNQEPTLMTETLARIYLEQKKYDNAIKAYEILSLKYPEKSGFFADQIKKIRILQNIK